MKEKSILSIAGQETLNTCLGLCQGLWWDRERYCPYLIFFILSHWHTWGALQVWSEQPPAFQLYFNITLHFWKLIFSDRTFSIWKILIAFPLLVQHMARLAQASSIFLLKVIIYKDVCQTQHIINTAIYSVYRSAFVIIELG